MTIFDVLTMVGGLCLFLFGMNVMGDSLERRAGGGLKLLLGKLTKTKMLAFLTGMGVTAVIQSSSATTVMVVGFVNSGLMTLKQSIGVIMGANIGTTITAWILSLGGISGDNPIIQLLKPSSFTPVLALVGIIILMTGKTSKKKDVAMILLGFATLMFGMETMSDAVSGLAEVPAFCELFLLFKNPILGVLVGAALTAIIQSSSASVGILQALTVTGQVSYGAAVPIIMGQNIGTCITALLSSFGANRNAKRAAVVHLSFNVIGTAVWLTVFSVLSFTFEPAILNESASFLGIAVAHSAFNLLCTVLLLPLSSLLEKLAYKLVPETKKNDDTTTLDERLIATPAVALSRSYAVVCDMAKDATRSCNMSLDFLLGTKDAIPSEIRELEDKTDRYEDLVSTYLIKLSSARVDNHQSSRISELLKVIGDYERISDHSINILEAAEELKEKNLEFTENAKRELAVLCDAAREILDLTYLSFTKKDQSVVSKIEALEQVIDDLKRKLRNQHVLRLQNRECTVEAGFIWADLLTNLERVSDHCSNVAACVLDSASDNLNLHESTRELKSHTDFETAYKEYSEKYALIHCEYQE